MPEPFPKLEFVEGYIPITPPQLTSLGGIPRNEPELPDPADSNGSAQDHADAVRESDYRNNSESAGRVSDGKVVAKVLPVVEAMGETIFSPKMVWEKIAELDRPPIRAVAQCIVNLTEKKILDVVVQGAGRRPTTYRKRVLSVERAA